MERGQWNFWNQFWTKIWNLILVLNPRKCPKLAKLVDKQKTQLTGKNKAPTSGSSQDRQTTNDNILITVRKMQVQAEKWPRPQQTHRKIDVKSD